MRTKTLLSLAIILGLQSSVCTVSALWIPTAEASSPLMTPAPVVSNACQTSSTDESEDVAGIPKRQGCEQSSLCLEKQHRWNGERCVFIGSAPSFFLPAYVTETQPLTTYVQPITASARAGPRAIHEILSLSVIVLRE